MSLDKAVAECVGEINRIVPELVTRFGLRVVIAALGVQVSKLDPEFADRLLKRIAQRTGATQRNEGLPHGR